MTHTEQTPTFNNEPLTQNMKKVNLKPGRWCWACTVCGSVYQRRGDAGICCGETKYKAKIAPWWPIRNRFKPYRKPVGRLDEHGKFHRAIKDFVEGHE